MTHIYQFLVEHISLFQEPLSVEWLACKCHFGSLLGNVNVCWGLLGISVAVPENKRYAVTGRHELLVGGTCQRA